MNMGFFTWNFRSLNWAEALGLMASKIEKYRMDFVWVQKVRQEGSGTLEFGHYTSLDEEGNASHQLETEAFVHRVHQIEFKVGIYPWCDITAVNVHDPLEEKDNNIKDSFYEEIERLFD